MKRQAKIEQLCRTIDDAIAGAEEADLPFVVVILEMARLEVDQIQKDNVETMPTPKPWGKGR